MKLFNRAQRSQPSERQPGEAAAPGGRRLEFLFLFTGAVLITTGWMLTYQVLNSLRGNAIRSFQVAQLQIVKAAADDFEDCIATSVASAQTAAPVVVEQCLTAVSALGNGQLWIVAAADVLDAAGLPAGNGWNNELTIEAFLAGQARGATAGSPPLTPFSGVDVIGVNAYVRGAEFGAESVVWAPVTIGDATWIVGLTTPQQAILDANGVPKQALLIVIVMALGTLVGLLLLMITISSIRKQKVAELELIDINADLELRIAQRTSELVAANEDMRNEFERRLALEQALHSSEERSRSLLDAVPDLLFVLDREGNYLEVLGNLEPPFFGSSEPLAGTNIRTHGPLAADLPHVAAAITAALDAGVTQEVSFHTGGRDGQDVWSARLAPINQREVLMLSRNVTAYASALATIERVNEELLAAYDATLLGWSRMLEVRENETAGHSQRVADLAVRLARRLGCNEAEVAQIRRGALLHDIGKMALPDEILRKAGALTADERRQMQQHPQLAYTWLHGITFLLPALDIPYFHHERWNGSGYPHGLAGEAIPLAARIFSVVDVWDALLADRPYKKRWPAAAATTYLCDHAGELFDPHVVEVFVAMIDEGGA